MERVEEKEMKKILLILGLIGILFFTSCNGELVLKSDGWEIYQCGWSLHDAQFLVQSHDGYVCNDTFYTEGIFTIDEETPEYVIENVLNHEIDVKITHDGERYWVELPALMQLTLKEEEE